MLYKLTEETPLMRVGEMMKINSGQMQQLQKEAVRSNGLCGVDVMWCNVM